jgi:hypothetical protein
VEIDAWATEEGGDERIRRFVIDLLGRAHLLHLAATHDDDTMAHRHRLDLIVRDINRRRLQPGV